jgi:hypothetical protein
LSLLQFFFNCPLLFSYFNLSRIKKIPKDDFLVILFIQLIFVGSYSMGC